MSRSLVRRPERPRPGIAPARSTFLLLALLIPGDVRAQEQEWSMEAPLAPSSLLLDAAITNGGLLAVGDRGHVLVSNDGGQTFAQVRVPTKRMLTAVAAQGDQCWAVGHDTLILHSDDGGRTWTEQYAAPEDEMPLFDVWFRDPGYGLAIGAYGLALYTEDGGDEWVETTVGDTDAHLFGISAATDGTLYVAGEFGSIFRSEDDGESWEACASPYGGSFFGALALEDGSVLVYGLRGNLFRSEDGGRSWTQLGTGTTAALLDATQLDRDRVEIVGLSGCRLSSADGGRTFSLAEREDRVALSHVSRIERGLLLLGEHGIERIADR